MSLWKNETIHPVVFPTMCSCGGCLWGISRCGKRVLWAEQNDSDDFKSEEVCRIECAQCGTTYAIRWDVETGKGYPILDGESAVADFLLFYEQSK
jgi:hypothetical protein